jgi:exodeoxyribonuclease V beta subunit
VRPGHLAVLVPTNRNAALVRTALEDAGVPAVINGAGSVFGTPAGREWLRLLEAIERPASPARARAATLTCFFGWSAEQLAAAPEEAWELVHRRLHQWARVLRVAGVAAMTETITAVQGMTARVLQATDGERRLTDLRHIGQLLHAAATAQQLGPTALTAWLRERVAEAERDTADEERSRRLESDAEAVQVLTVHRSKGLQFPVVYLPFLWEPGYVPRGSPPIVFHDPGEDDRRVIDVSLEGSEYQAHRQQGIDEQRGEDLRLAYVALTRAKHQAVVWWAGSFDSRNSPLGRLLFAREPDGSIAAAGAGTPTDAAAAERFRSLAADAPGCISVERSALGLPAAWAGPLAPPADLAAARFDRDLDWGWRRTSYSDITAGTYEARVASEPEEAVVEDEPAEAGPGPFAAGDDGDGSSADAALPSLLAGLPAGVHVGTLVHRVLEATDFDAPDLDAALETQIGAAQAWRRVEVGDPAALIAGLRAFLETPLGPLLGGARLRDVPRADRLDELEFELPLAGGDTPAGRVTLAAIAGVLREHLPAGDPLAGYAERLSDPALRQQVRGYLTGSLDLVVRTRGADGVPRFAVVDYKTNWLGPTREQLTTWDHRPSVLAAEMQQRHYGLQAILYTVALHRYLRWRLPGYDAERNLAGVLYLFVRGMVGAGTPSFDGTPAGVFAWRPPPALVEALSDVLDGAEAQAV